MSHTENKTHQATVPKVCVSTTMVDWIFPWQINQNYLCYCFVYFFK